ncbi:MAG: YkuS family protein [Bacillota bacterium]
MLIAVEDGLDQVERALRQEGFEITKLTPGAMSAKVDAAVVTGMSDNFMGIHDTNGNKFPVIDASGKTADEVVRQVRDRAGRK